MQPLLQKAVAALDAASPVVAGAMQDARHDHREGWWLVRGPVKLSR